MENSPQANNSFEVPGAPPLFDLASEGAPFDLQNENISELSTQGYPYSSVIQNISNKHFADIKAAIPRSITNNHSARNRLRDFLATYNETLVSNFVDRGRLSSSLSLAEHVFRKYGKGAQIQGQLKELNLDSSIKDTMAEIDKEIQWIAPSPSFGAQTSPIDSQCELHVTTETEKLIWRLRRIMELYRNTALALMKAEETLKTRCESLEKLSSHLLLVATLPESENYGELLKVNQCYLEDIFKKTKVKEAYDDMICLYKKWMIWKLNYFNKTSCWIKTTCHHPFLMKVI